MLTAVEEASAFYVSMHIQDQWGLIEATPSTAYGEIASIFRKGMSRHESINIEDIVELHRHSQLENLALMLYIDLANPLKLSKKP
jgi:hypothetical protein